MSLKASVLPTLYAVVLAKCWLRRCIFLGYRETPKADGRITSFAERGGVGGHCRKTEACSY